jgi:hypothetical protein
MLFSSWGQCIHINTLLSSNHRQSASFQIQLKKVCIYKAKCTEICVNLNFECNTFEIYEHKNNLIIIYSIMCYYLTLTSRNHCVLFFRLCYNFWVIVCTILSISNYDKRCRLKLCWTIISNSITKGSKADILYRCVGHICQFVWMCDAVY